LLKISIQEADNMATLTIEGKLKGPWVTELDRVWEELMPRLRGRQLNVDIRGLMFVDNGGKEILKSIFQETGAELIADTPWTKHIANEIHQNAPLNSGKEKDNA